MKQTVAEWLSENATMLMFLSHGKGSLVGAMNPLLVECIMKQSEELEFLINIRKDERVYYQSGGPEPPHMFGLLCESKTGYFFVSTSLRLTPLTKAEAITILVSIFDVINPIQRIEELQKLEHLNDGYLNLLLSRNLIVPYTTDILFQKDGE